MFNEKMSCNELISMVLRLYIKKGFGVLWLISLTLGSYAGRL